MHLFYTPDIEENHYTLNEEESRHCIKVLRLNINDTVYLIDGKGGFYTAAIIEAHPKHTQLTVLEVKSEFQKRNHYLHIAIAPPKNIERFEWFLEKATEIGIDEITPIICERSERKEVKHERLIKIITSAVKQSLKAYHPKLNEALKLKSLLSKPFISQKFIAHCMEEKKAYLQAELKVRDKYLILIGPEGDFTPDEVGQSLQSGFIPVTLGESRLRTETAGLQACFEINFLNRLTL